jgi:hypothetical protein
VRMPRLERGGGMYGWRLRARDAGGNGAGCKAPEEPEASEGELRRGAERALRVCEPKS